MAKLWLLLGALVVALPSVAYAQAADPAAAKAGASAVAPQQITPSPAVPSGPAIAGVVELTLADWPTGHVTDGGAYRLLSAQEAFAWPDGGGRGGIESGIGRIAIPSFGRNADGYSRFSHIAVANLVPVPGFTDYQLIIFDQNGLLDFVCQTLNASQVEYTALDQWGYVSNGFRGSALISAIYWEHDVLQEGQIARSALGLAAVVADWSVAAGSRPATGAVAPAVPLDAGIGLPRLFSDDRLYCGPRGPAPPWPTATHTPGPSPTPTPTATVTPTPATPPPYAPGAPAHFLPALEARADDVACAAEIVVQNVGTEVTKAIALLWGAPSDCGDACAGPFYVLCPPTIEPGSSIVLSLADAPPGVRSAVVFSFTTEYLDDPPFAICDPVADIVCETLFYGVIGDCGAYAAFKQAYDRGLVFAGIPMDLAHGAPLAVQVRRECDGPEPAGLPVTSAYTGLWGPALGRRDPIDGRLYYHLPVVRGGDAGARSVVHVQNAGHACADVELWATPDGDCGGAERCAAFALAPGEARIVDAPWCIGSAAAGSAWVQSTVPVAVAVDTAAGNVQTTYTGQPDDWRDMHGQRLLGATDAVAFAPLVYANHFGWSTRVRVHTTGGPEAVLKITLLDRSGDPVSVRQIGPLCPFVSADIDVSAMAGVPHDWLGSLRVESYPASAAPVATPWTGPEPSSTPERTPGSPFGGDVTRTPGTPPVSATVITPTPSATFERTREPTATVDIPRGETAYLPAVLRRR